MPTLQIRFPAGRYHATPSGCHVNEGQIEWPPSPWRLLRALIACGFNTQHWSDVPDTARSLLHKLAAVAPRYRVPSAAAAHSRHYMPLGVLDKGREKTTLVFDTWADVGDGLLTVRWDCELAHAEATLLSKLAACLNYLGRSESWIEAELVDDVDESGSDFNVYCHEAGEHPGPGWEQTNLLAPVLPDDYRTWRERTVAAALESFPLPTGKKKPTKKLLSERQRAIEPYPTDLLECLTRDTVWWKNHRWAQPPGSQQSLYWRRANLLEVASAPRLKVGSTPSITTMLLALTTPSGSKSALPSVKRTLPQAELIHAALVRKVGRGKRVDCPELTGRDFAGRPLRNMHAHAHVLPLDLDTDGHIEHVLIHASMGLSSEAQQAVRSLTQTYTKGGVGDLQVSVAGVGDAKQLLAVSSRYRKVLHNLLGQASLEGETCTVFQSVTPFVPPRFVKRSGKNTLAGQVKDELRSRGLPDTRNITVLERESKAFRHFVRARTRGNNPPQPRLNIGFAVEIEFDRPPVVEKLPFALGYGSHFGLGLFAAGHSTITRTSNTG